MSFPILTSFGGVRRFGVEGMTGIAHIARINELADGASGDAPGIRWSVGEPNAPNPGHVYPGDPASLQAKIATLHGLGRKYHTMVFPDAAWAMETAGAPSKLVRILPAHLDDWTAFVTHIVTTFDIDFLQVENEPEPDWEMSTDGAAGFADAVRLTYDAVKAVRPDTTVMFAGFNAGIWFMQDPVPGHTWLTFMQDVLNGVGDKYDIFSYHLNHMPEVYAPTVAWIQAAMVTAGHTRPIWADDMQSGPRYEAPYSDPDDVDFQDLVETGDADAVLEYYTRQAKFAVMRPVMAFAVGVQRVFVANDINWEDFPLPLWNYQGLLMMGSGTRKPAFYSYKQLIAAIDGWYTAEQVGSDQAYKFTFRGKGPAAVAWQPSAGPGTVDLSSIWPSQNVRVIPVVTTLDGSNLPIYPAESTPASTVVPVSSVPVIVKGLG